MGRWVVVVPSRSPARSHDIVEFCPLRADSPGTTIGRLVPVVTPGAFPAVHILLTALDGLAYAVVPVPLGRLGRMQKLQDACLGNSNLV